MRNVLALFCLLVCAFSVQSQAPYQAVLDVYTDLSYMPADAQPYIRYLDLGNLTGDKEEYQRYINILSGHVNLLSKYSKIQPPVLVKNYLLRMDIRDYAWDPKVYEQFAIDDPYYHVKATVTPATPAKEDKKVDPAKKADVKDLWAPWLYQDANGLQKLTKMYDATGSTTIILRADWFFHQTAVQEKRTVGYYGMLGIKKIEDFEAAMRFDRKLTKDLERTRVVMSSEITLEPRRLEAVKSATGDVWRTFDSEVAIGKKNPLEFLDDELEYDASEQFGHLPNGLPVWWLGNGKDVRQDKAPDNIVGGDQTKVGERRGRGNDRRLHISLSCIRCHFTGANDGVKEFTAEHIDRLVSVSYEKKKELEAKYLAEIEPRVKASRLVYETAIKQAAGMPSKEFGKAYDEFWSRYDNAHVDLKRAAADMGVEPAQLQTSLDRQQKILGRLHSSLNIIKNGGYIPINQWQEVYSLAHAYLRGVQP